MERRLSLLSLLAVIPLGNTSAALISIVPGNVIASSEISSSNPQFPRDAFRIVDGSGLSGGAHNNGADDVAWLSSGNGFGGIDTDPSVTFDLGQVYTISSFNVWNYNENATGVQTTRGVNAVSVNYGTTPALGSTVPGITNFAIADGTNSYAGENFNGFTPFNARYIMFDIDTNHGDGNTFYGLSEVQFDGVAIPEPSSLALLAFLALPVLRRRRA